MVNDTKLKADAVKILLKFIYNNFNFKEVTGINSASVWDVIYAGNQFKNFASYLMAMAMNMNK